MDAARPWVEKRHTALTVKWGGVSRTQRKPGKFNGKTLRGAYYVMKGSSPGDRVCLSSSERDGTVAPRLSCSLLLTLLWWEFPQGREMNRVCLNQSERAELRLSHCIPITDTFVYKYSGNTQERNENTDNMVGSCLDIHVRSELLSSLCVALHLIVDVSC